jgi:hypothetical protein
MGDIEIDIEQERELLANEFSKWEELKLPHPREVFNVDEFHLTARLDALCDLLVQLELIDATVYEALIIKQLRERMEMMKPDLTKMIRQAGIAPNNGAKLFGPDGRPLI